MSYNVRLYEYAESRQIRIYSKTIGTDKEENENEKTETYENTEQHEKDNYTITSPFDGTELLNVEFEDYLKFKESKRKRSQSVSMNRSKQNIYELARANKWEYFITLTFDRNKIDSSDYDSLVKQVGKWFNNVKSRKAPNLKYMIVPELHKDGIHYHFHGLLANCDGLSIVDSGVVQDGKTVYNLTDFKYGFTTATKVQDTNKVSSYICKYITKELETVLKGKRRYIASRNCDRPQIIEYNLTDDEIKDMLDSVTPDVTHMKTQQFAEFGQSVRYIELKR